MMTVDESLVSSFQILKPVDKKPIVYFALGALPQLSLVLQQKPRYFDSLNPFHTLQLFNKKGKLM
ncbi:hypothetical protein ACSQ67_026309 [Phaseolus vulgaris]